MLQNSIQIYQYNGSPVTFLKGDSVMVNATEMAKAFDLPDYIKPRCLLPIGYPTDDCEPFPPWHYVNKGIDEFSEEI